MEKAIEVMRESLAEPRPDGKAVPLVGAVLLKRDGDVQSAHRGELREGDHAEFTLLERKNRANKLDGSVLYATLEPCAPGARNHPKLSCAERIVNARIREVYVGIEDPDPTVDRKGIAFLQERGVTVNMFDRDLQDTIREANKDFIAQALERSAAESPRDTRLSKLESAVASANLEDLSEEALKRYRTAFTLTADDLNVAERVLAQQGLMKVDGEQAKPAGFGLLLLGRQPRVSLPQAGLLGTIRYADGKEETKDFDGPMVLIPELAIQWLKDKLPNVIDRSEARRKQTLDVPSELVREGVVNALVHRDYDILGAKCQLVVTPDTIEIRSPGEPVKPITLEQLQSFNAPMLSRNPVLHYVFAKMELAEERGFGLKSMRTRSTQAGLPLPTYRWESPYLVLTLYRSAMAATRALDAAVLAQMSQEELDGWTALSSQDVTRQSDYASKLDITARTAQRHLTHFVELGLLKRVGRGPATEYRKA